MAEGSARVETKPLNLPAIVDPSNVVTLTVQVSKEDVLALGNHNVPEEAVVGVLAERVLWKYGYWPEEITAYEELPIRYVVEFEVSGRV